MRKSLRVAVVTAGALLTLGVGIGTASATWPANPTLPDGSPNPAAPAGTYYPDGTFIPCGQPGGGSCTQPGVISPG
ncbi:hypothetical protein [Nocardia transvalensis]|uniref:hypothetical protein n=1 Tax=Nocardia transvalensis TaxID=37333 RepID=UPI00189391D1|nr:hypothetical protein [Nocardia transvalensis]MBF6334015.1 hypothetical protein [Nocardia transvalensis]